MRGDEMTETSAPDYGAMAHEEMTALEGRRGLVYAELEACKAELRNLRGDEPGTAPGARYGMLAFEAVLGDEEAASILEADARREKYLEERASLCKAALAHVDGHLEGLRKTWLGGHQAASLPLEEIPEVLRERIRAAREAEGS